MPARSSRTRLWTRRSTIRNTPTRGVCSGRSCDSTRRAAHAWRRFPARLRHCCLRRRAAGSRPAAHMPSTSAMSRRRWNRASEVAIWTGAGLIHRRRNRFAHRWFREHPKASASEDRWAHARRAGDEARTGASGSRGMSKGDPLLEVTDLVKHFPIKSGVVIDREVARVRAVDGVSLTLREGETLGLVGESGCGKSTLCRAILQLTQPTSGSVRFLGEELVGRSRRDLRPLRGEMQMSFQDPFGSLNPPKRVGQVDGDPLELHGLAKGAELKRRVQDLLDRVGLSPEHYNRYPHEFSGGQRQRIGIARALALQPKFIVADEPVSALDVSIQAQILNLLEDLQKQMNLSYLFIAHNLAVVEHFSDRVAVMYLGRIVEIADAVELYRNPKHPYTVALLSAVPKPNPNKEAGGGRIVLGGEVPSP